MERTRVRPPFPWGHLVTVAALVFGIVLVFLRQYQPPA